VILAAALLVLVGAGLFVAGLLTGVSVLYWACVAACVVAAVLLIAARRSMPAAPARAPLVERPTAEAAGTAPSSAVAEPVVPAAGAASGEPVPPEAAAPAEPTAAAAPAEPAVVAAAGATAVTATPAAEGTEEGLDEPPVEEVEVTDLLLVVDLTDEVLVIDEHPRYHVAGCSHLTGRTPIPLPLDEARTDGFTPCGACRPDATLADRVRAKR
jgi:hypothetical protein